MARAHIRLCLSTLTVLTLFQLLTPSSSSTITITNNCNYTVWPAIQSNSGSPTLQPTGFVLSKKDDFQSLTAPTSWNGRVWGRTLCSSDSSGNFSCVTGDCGTSKINCSSGSGSPSLATLAEFSLSIIGETDIYDVSIVNGYNLPMLVVPKGSPGGNCNATGCSMDLNQNCPQELKVFKSSQDVACRNPCTGQSANNCQPSNYTDSIKIACPMANSYPTNAATSTFSCSGAPDYVITFCPNATSLKQVQAYQNPPPPPVPPMVFIGGNDDNKNHQNSFAVLSSIAPLILVLVDTWLILTHLLLSA